MATTRMDIDALVEHKPASIEWHQVTSLSAAPAIEPTGFGMESQMRSGQGYIAYFYHFHDGPAKGATLCVYHLEETLVDWSSLAQDVTYYVQKKEADGWR